jgi:nanoRNase/pAp phosphatase (c-di-AMP/oligoRNAs hydrolase)
MFLVKNFQSVINRLNNLQSLQMDFYPTNEENFDQITKYLYTIHFTILERNEMNEENKKNKVLSIHSIFRDEKRLIYFTVFIFCQQKLQCQTYHIYHILREQKKITQIKCVDKNISFEYIKTSRWILQEIISE